MTERKTDEAIRQKASRLRLTFVRDHVAEVLDIADKTKMTPREVIDYVFGKEIEQRDVNRYKQALMAAHFPAVKTLEDFDFSKQPSINTGVIRELKSLEWLEAGENVTLFGPPGVGKTIWRWGWDVWRWNTDIPSVSIPRRLYWGYWRKQYETVRWKPNSKNCPSRSC